MARESFSTPEVISYFQDRSLPKPAILAGYAALINHYQLKTVLPPLLAATGDGHTKSSTDSWQILTTRHAPSATLSGHLTFALKWEGVQLGVLAALFEVLTSREMKKLVSEKPTGAY